MKRFLLLLPLLFLAGCNSVEVKPLPHDPDFIAVRIIHNPDVRVSDFAEEMRIAFARRGIAAEVDYARKTSFDPKEYTATYTALRSWDFAPYLSHAEVRIFRNHRLMGEGIYHHNGGSFSLAFNKWRGTRWKVTPLFNELLKNYPETP